MLVSIVIAGLCIPHSYCQAFEGNQIDAPRPNSNQSSQTVIVTPSTYKNDQVTVIYNGQERPDKVMLHNYHRRKPVSGDLPYNRTAYVPSHSYSASARPAIGGKRVPAFIEYPKAYFPDKSRPWNGTLKTGSPMYPREDGFGPRIGFGGDETPDQRVDDVTAPSVRSEASAQLSWLVSVLSKEVIPYQKVCSGSLVSNTAVISAAHCFWSEGRLPATLFAVTAESVSHAQQSDVCDIRIPPRFRGDATSFQDDIAVLLLEQPLSHSKHFQPVCVSFDRELDDRQLSDGRVGVKIEKALDSTPERVVVKLEEYKVPYVEVEKCMRLSEKDPKYITSDKICAGVKIEPLSNQTCQNSGGGGLVFFQGEAPTAIPYLRGVASTVLTASCDACALAAYTHVQAHRRFLLEHVSGLEEACEQYYPQLRETEDASEEGEEFVCNCYC